MRPYIQMVQKRLPAPPLKWRIDMVVFSFTIVVVLYVFMIIPQPYNGGPDLPRVRNPIGLPDANRDDALMIILTRDGKIFFQMDQVTAQDLPRLIRDSINRGSKPEIFFKVDARARAGHFMEAFDAIRPTGVQSISILADQRRTALPE